MIDLRGKKTALVLSGGGAKGAYQLGMFRALEEAGLDRDRLVLAGTSIGAINAILYATRGTEGMREMLHILGGLKEFVSLGELAGQLCPDELLAKNRIPVTACAYSHVRKRPEYFYLNDFPPEEQRLLVSASASLPPVYPPVEFRGELYSDGAVVPESLIRTDGEGNAAKPKQGPDAPQPGDKIPVRALKDCACDVMIISFLKPGDSVDPDLLPAGCICLESRPSEPLEDKPGTGTLDFRPERLRKSEEMGYAETMKLLGEFSL